MSKRKITLGLIAAAAGVCAAVHAGQSEDRATRSIGIGGAVTSDSAEPSDAAREGRGIVIGELIDVRDVSVRGAEGRHRLLKIRAPGGRVVVVDIGVHPGSAADGAFGKGDRIVAVGSMARLNGQPLLYARYVGRLREVGRTGLLSSGRQ